MITRKEAWQLIQAGYMWLVYAVGTGGGGWQGKKGSEERGRTFFSFYFRLLHVAKRLTRKRSEDQFPPSLHQSSQGGIPVDRGVSPCALFKLR